MKSAAKHLSLDNWLRAAVDLGAFLAGLTIGWIIFDNIAVALMFALILGGGSAATRAVRR